MLHCIPENSTSANVHSAITACPAASRQACLLNVHATVLKWCTLSAVHCHQSMRARARVALHEDCAANRCLA